MIKLALVTGQRIGELRNLRWGHIDGRWWTIPEEIAKNGLAHPVYLSDLAMDLLMEARATCADGCEFVFPGGDPSTPMDRNTPDRFWRRNREKFGLADVRIHDLRRTCGTKLAEIGVPRLVVGKVLNHAERGVTAIYDRHTYRPEIKDALTRWSSHLCGLLGITTGPHEIDVQGIARRLLSRIEAAHRDKDRTANYIAALQICFDSNIEPPAWLKNTFIMAASTFQSRRVPSFNEALGIPCWKKSELSKKDYEGWRIVAVVDDLLATGSVTPTVFIETAEILNLGIGEKQIERLYYSRRR